MPERKTDLLYLDFEEPFYLDRHIETKVTIPYPVEIGVFIKKSDTEQQLLDCFCCDQSLCGFALYGTPTEGEFCKYSNIDFDMHPDVYSYGMVDIFIHNNMDSATTMNKVVCNPTQQNIYYGNGKINLDPLKVVIDKGGLVASVSVQKIENDFDCNVSPKIQQETSGSFIMKEGIN